MLKNLAKAGKLNTSAATLSVSGPDGDRTESIIGIITPEMIAQHGFGPALVSAALKSKGDSPLALSAGLSLPLGDKKAKAAQGKNLIAPADAVLVSWLEDWGLSVPSPAPAKPEKTPRPRKSAAERRAAAAPVTAGAESNGEGNGTAGA